MDTEFLKDLAQVAGIGGIAFGVLLIVFRDVIRKNAFSKLTKDQSFQIFRLVLILTWSIALVAVSGWLFIQISQGDRLSDGISVDSPLFSARTAEDRFFSVVVNNNSASNIIVKKISYSRGVSSKMLIMNNTCCRYCGGATEFTIAPFSIESAEKANYYGTVPATNVETGSDSFIAKVSFSHGCAYPTEAQVELPVQVAIPMRTTIALKVRLLDPDSVDGLVKLRPINDEIASLVTLAERDTVCIILETDIIGELRTCQPENELHESGHWFL